MTPKQRLLGVRPTRRVMWRLLIASVLLPFASNEIAAFGSRMGLYGTAWIGLLHVILMTCIFVILTLMEGLTTQRVESIQAEALGRVQLSEERLKLQIDRMPLACMTINRDFIITSWNPAAERIFGYTEGEIVGQPFSPLLPHGLAGELKTRWELLISGHTMAHGINTNVTSDGRTILCRWTNTPMTDATGVPSVLAMAEDITNEQRTEIALRHSEKRFRELVNQLPHIIFSVDNERRYTAVNAAACRALGHAEGDILGKTSDELGIEPGAFRQLLAQKAITRASGRTETGDLLMPIDGRMRNMYAITSPMRDESGVITGVTGIVIDVTEQRAAEAGMSRLLAAVEQLREVMFTTDREDVITYVNPAFEAVYGWRREEAVGQTPRVLMCGQMDAAAYSRFRSELLAGRSVRSEYRNRKKDGTLVDVISSVSPVFDEQHQIIAFAAVQQDVTQARHDADARRRMEEQLSQLAKMDALGTLAGGIAHDFNNILSIVLSHVTLIDRKRGDAEAVTRAVDTVREAVRRGAKLSRQILTYARRAELHTENVDIGNLIIELASMITETFPRTVEVALDLDPDLPVINADADQLHQALLNLCVNARDAMPAGGQLKIGASLVRDDGVRALTLDAMSGDSILITVSDNGTGMDAETQRRIFEPFFTTKEKGRGTGLGLALVYGVAKGHGGLIEVDSHPGHGTQFRLYLPIVRPVTPAIESEPDRAAVGGSATLLVIDDEPAILESLTLQLREHGYHVSAARNGPEAIEICRRIGPPDVVVMDLGMPKMPAVDLLRGLREIAPGLPVVAMTGYLDPDVHSSVLAEGVHSILSKPFEVDELLRRLRDVIEGP